MELAKELSNNIQINNQLIKTQNSFLESSLWKIINSGLNLGIRALLPNFIEDQVIEIKDALINGGFKKGAKQAIKSAIDIGKSATGIITGNFQSISQAQNVIKSGGMLDGISDVLNKAIDVSVKNKWIDSSVGNIIKKGKNVILNTIESNIEGNFNDQISSLQKISTYSDNWKQYYKNHDFDGMEKEYKKIKNNMKAILPIENTIKEMRELENLHLLIKNNGKNFDLSTEERALAKELVN